MSFNYNGGGAAFYDIPIVQPDGTAPEAAVADQCVVAFEPTAGAFNAITVANQPDVPRNVTFGVVDANSSITSAAAVIVGTDYQDRSLQETISFPGGGTDTIIGLLCFKTIDESKSYIAVAGVVTGGMDTVQLGYGNAFGTPLQIASVDDVTNRRVDNTTGVGSISVANQSWDVTANPPDGAKMYFISIHSSASG